MSFLPIVDRELRVRARLKSTYRIRWAAALLAMLIVSSMMFAAEVSSARRQIGSVMFVTLAWLAFVFCFLEGIRNTADCLSEEKREGTIGLLFLTDLKGYDVVLGKLIATSLNSFYGLLAIFPALAIPILFGGVTGAELWRMVLLLANTLFFSVTAGVLVSSISRHQRKAWLGTLAIIGGFIVVPFAVGGLCGWIKPNAPAEFILHFSPGYAFVAALDSINSGRPGGFWNSWLTLHFFAWVFLLLAAFLLPRLWQEGSATRESGLWRKPLFGFTSATGLKRAVFRRESLAINPVFWLAGRDDRQRAYIWLLAGAFVVTGLIWGQFSYLKQGSALAYVPLFHLALRIWVILQACHFFVEARRTGAMELLLSTPLTGDEIVRGQLLALKRFFGWPSITVVAAEMVLLMGQILTRNQDWFFTAFVSGVSGGWGILRLIPDLCAAAYVGMWQGVSARKPSQAVVLAILYAVVLPAALFCIPNIIIDFFLIFWAQRRLSEDFRATAVRSLGFTPMRMLWF